MQKNVVEDSFGTDFTGEVWIYTSIKQTSYFLISVTVGKHTQETFNDMIAAGIAKPSRMCFRRFPETAYMRTSPPITFFVYLAISQLSFGRIRMSSLQADTTERHRTRPGG